jgi:hypothetical protein
MWTTTTATSGERATGDQGAGAAAVLSKMRELVRDMYIEDVMQSDGPPIHTQAEAIKAFNYFVKHADVFDALSARQSLACVDKLCLPDDDGAVS